MLLWNISYSRFLLLILFLFHSIIVNDKWLKFLNVFVSLTYLRIKLILLDKQQFLQLIDSLWTLIVNSLLWFVLCVNGHLVILYILVALKEFYDFIKLCNFILFKLDLLTQVFNYYIQIVDNCIMMYFLHFFCSQFTMQICIIFTKLLY